jgi:hypothetical protein
MYKSLQLYIPGDVKDPTDLHIWKLDSEYLEDDGASTVKLFRCQFNFQCSCSAGLEVTEGSDYILIARCGTHNNDCKVPRDRAFSKKFMRVQSASAILLTASESSE